MPNNPLQATIFKKRVDVYEDEVTYLPGDVAIIPHPDNGTLDKRGLMLNPELLKVRPVTEVFKDYRIHSTAKQVFIQMSDGIGDYFFFSAVVKWLHDFRGIDVTLFVDRKLWPVMEWFEEPIFLRHFSDQIVRNYKPFTNTPERLAFEYAGVEGRERLWISCLFDRIGASPSPDYLRPRLRTDRVSNLHAMIPSDGVLICHRASSPSRSSRFEDFYRPWNECNPLDPVYVHQTDCTPQDLEFIKACENVTVLPKVTIERYLLNVYDAAFVISTDSSAIHFREGVEKPALGVYASMEAKSRTAHYLHTKSIDVKSDCPFQPCYFHQQLPSDRCKMFTYYPNETKTAKCQTGAKFQEQLKEAIKNY
jgi:hypothetical protein